MPEPGSRATVAEWLAEHPHAYSRSELLRVWSRWDVDSAARAGAVARLAPAVYASPAHARDPLVRGEAIALWNSHALVTGELALFLYAHELPAPPIADAVVPYGAHPRTPQGVRVIQRAPAKFRSSPSGVPCVLPERALLDAWHLATAARPKSVFYEALWARATTASALSRELARTPKVRGRRALEQLLGHFSDGAMSPVEVFARTEVFVGTEWAAFERQASIAVAGRTYRADMLHASTRVIIELDGRRYHAKSDRAERDRIRDAELASRGYVTVRLSPRDLADRAEWCRQMVRGAVASRRVA